MAPIAASIAASRPSVSRTDGIRSVPFAWQSRLATPTIKPIFAQKRTLD
jgi:hypothetical protein